MAIFSNQATLVYNGNTTNSNIAYGEILDVLAATKTAVEGTYTPGDLVTYVVTLRNTGNTTLNGLILTDDLGGYQLSGATVYPLTYEAGSAALFVDGIPGGSDAVLVYQARANSFANPAEGGTIVNTVTVTGNGLSTPATATETVTAAAAPVLTISKSINPTQVVDNDRVTYTFVIQNSGNQAVVATDNAAITDVFDPVLTDLTVTYNGIAWTEGVQYTYDQATGLFSTLPGSITVPAATYTQDPVTGAYTVTPGIATLVVTGTI